MSTALTTSGGISYRELTRHGEPETYRGTLGRTTVSLERKFRVAWVDLLRFVSELLGPVYVDGELIVYGNALKFPDLGLDVDCPEVVSCDIEGYGVSSRDGADNSASYTDAIVTAHYELPVGFKKRNNSDEFIIITEEPGSIATEFITLPDNGFLWTNSVNPEGDPLGAKATPGVLVGTQDYSVTIYRQPIPPFEAMADLQGKVNNGKGEDSNWPATGTNLNDALAFQFDDGHLLYLGTQVTEKAYYDITAGGFVAGYDLKHRFKFRTERWNTAYRAGAPAGALEGWQDFQTKDGDQLYEGGDFDRLFTS